MGGGGGAGWVVVLCARCMYPPDNYVARIRRFYARLTPPETHSGTAIFSFSRPPSRVLTLVHLPGLSLRSGVRSYPRDDRAQGPRTQNYRAVGRCKTLKFVQTRS